MNLTEKQLQELEGIIMEFPTKYGVQIIQFFNSVKQQTINEDKEKLTVVPAEETKE